MTDHPAPDEHWTRIGLMVPSSNTSVETDFARARRPGVSLHAARMWLTGSDADGLDRMNEDIETAARHLASADVALLVYACTGGSMLQGMGYDRALAARISALAGGVATVTTSTAALEALKALDMTRVTLLTPYPPRMTEIVRGFLEANGIEVVAVAGRNHPDNLAIGADPPAAIAEFALAHEADGSDGFFCSCTNWRSMAAAAAIERASGKPVVTSNQATIWAAYRRLGLGADLSGFGRLFALH